MVMVLSWAVRLIIEITNTIKIFFIDINRILADNYCFIKIDVDKITNQKLLINKKIHSGVKNFDLKGIKLVLDNHSLN